MDYVLVGADSEKKLQKKINKLINCGYKLKGDLIVKNLGLSAGFYFYQALIKKKVKDNGKSLKNQYPNTDLPITSL